MLPVFEPRALQNNARAQCHSCCGCPPVAACHAADSHTRQRHIYSHLPVSVPWTQFQSPNRVHKHASACTTRQSKWLPTDRHRYAFLNFYCYLEHCSYLGLYLGLGLYQAMTILTLRCSPFLMYGSSRQHQLAVTAFANASNDAFSTCVPGGWWAGLSVRRRQPEMRKIEDGEKTERPRRIHN